MKKIAILLIALTVAFSYSCKKEGKKVQTSISGTLITNGTNDPVQLTKELPNPIVILFHRTFSSGGVVAGEYVAVEVARTTVDDNATFRFNLDLNEGDEYFLGFSGLDKSKYYDRDEDWSGYQNYFPVVAGMTNVVNPSPLAISFVRPRFINSNTDPNNHDVFQYISGLPTKIVYIDPNTPVGSLVFHGSTDSTLSSIHKTWSGETQYGGANSNTHKVEGKLTRNGVTTDIEIVYNAPPFDTTVVDIYY